MADGEDVSKVYEDRNLLAQLAAILARRCGLHVGTMLDKELTKPEEWPLIYIELPTGQVSWHIPKGEMVAQLEPFGQEWDNHTPEEKQGRIREFLQQDVSQDFGTV